jgi:catechol 2,3-dioxygenase-like lactoylglutathione lyase family enzyme
VELRGLDHLYVTVSDLARSERFYDAVMAALGFRKGDSPIGGEPHAHYFNRFLQYTIRPARDPAARHDPYAPGLHHVCFQAPDEESVREAWRRLQELGVAASEPRLYPEYNPDYYAIFFEDPDGLRLEIVARMASRDEIERRFSDFSVFLNPLRELRKREGRSS